MESRGVDCDWLAVPGGTRVLEAPDQLLLFGVDADDRQPARGEVLANVGDVFELGVAVLGRGLGHPGELLVVDPE